MRSCFPTLWRRRGRRGRSFVRSFGWLISVGLSSQWQDESVAEARGRMGKGGILTVNDIFVGWFLFFHK